MIYKYFLPLYVLPFILLKASFDKPTFLISKGQFVIFLLLPLLLVSYSINHCQIQSVEVSSPLFSLTVLVLALKFRSLVHIGLNFVYGIRYGFSVTVFHVDIIFPALLFENTVFLAWPWHPSQKSFEKYEKVYYRALYSIVSFMQVLYPHFKKYI